MKDLFSFIYIRRNPYSAEKLPIPQATQRRQNVVISTASVGQG